MAFGNRSSNAGSLFGPNTKVFFVSIKEKDLPQPFFEIKTKEGDKNYVVVHSVKDEIKFLGGDLVDLRNKTSEHNGKEIVSVSATFVDRVKDEAYIVTLSESYLGRNIVNSLIALKTFNGVEIGLYCSKPKEGHAKGFNSAAVRQNGALIYGKFKNEQLPKIPKVKVGKDVHSDTTEITAFFAKQVEEFAKVLRAAQPAGAATASNSVGSASHGDQHDQGPSDDSFLPEDEPPVSEGKGQPIPF